MTVVIAALCATFFWCIRPILSPSEDTLRDLAQIGATLSIAYAVECSWLVKSSRSRSAEREKWIGVVIGVGASAMLAIGLSLILSEHTDEWGWLCELGFAWVFGALLMLACLVVALPNLMYGFSQILQRERAIDLEED